MKLILKQEYKKTKSSNASNITKKKKTESITIEQYRKKQQIKQTKKP